MTNSPRRLFCFGLGFTALALARRLEPAAWRIAGTCQGADRQQDLAAAGIAKTYLFDDASPLADPEAALGGITDLLITIPPGTGGDRVLAAHGEAISSMPDLIWIGYLSTTGVYGDTGGRPVAEDARRQPTSERSRRRVAAEDAWLALGAAGLPVHVFRLAGIYGPGRSALDEVRAGRARRIDRPDRKFSRIHVDDIAAVLSASMAQPRPGAVYNVSDDEAAPAADITSLASELLGVRPPPLIPFADAARDMTAMAFSFWRDDRRVDNALIKRELGVTLAYPTYREGLRAILAAER